MPFQRMMNGLSGAKLAPHGPVDDVVVNDVDEPIFVDDFSAAVPTMPTSSLSIGALKVAPLSLLV